MILKHLWNLGIVMVLATYPVLMVMGFNQGTLNIWTGLLLTVFSVLMIGVFSWLPKYLDYLERRIYEARRIGKL